MADIQWVARDAARWEVWQRWRAQEMGPPAEGAGPLLLRRSAWETLWQARNQLRAALAQPVDLRIYLDGWGMEWTADLDSARLRVLLMSTQVGHPPLFVDHFMRFTDVFVVMDAEVKAAVQGCLPAIPSARIQVFADVFGQGDAGLDSLAHTRSISARSCPPGMSMLPVLLYDRLWKLKAMGKVW